MSAECPPCDGDGMDSSLPPEVARQVNDLCRQIHELRDPIPDLAQRLSASVAALDGLSTISASSTSRCQAWQTHLERAVDELDSLTTTARSALQDAGHLLGDLSSLIEADERRRAEERAAEARRRQLDEEVDRLAAAEDAEAEATRRERLETEARERLALTTTGADHG